MTTPHIHAQRGDFADTVLMPGDPLRAKHIADTFLENVKNVNTVRNVLGFTGAYQGKPISVMASGMGIPSCSIYARELFVDFGVKNIIRVGTCGAISRTVKLRDIIIALGASTDSGVNRSRFMGHDFAAIADYELLEKAIKTARQFNVHHHIGNIFSSDLFYHPNEAIYDTMEKMGILAVEMEAAGLYSCAAAHGGKALTILTVSDHIRTHESTTPQERQTSFNDMIKLALDAFSE